MAYGINSSYFKELDYFRFIVMVDDVLELLHKFLYQHQYFLCCESQLENNSCWVSKTTKCGSSLHHLHSYESACGLVEQR